MNELTKEQLAAERMDWQQVQIPKKDGCYWVRKTVSYSYAIAYLGTAFHNRKRYLHFFYKREPENLSNYPNAKFSKRIKEPNERMG